LLNYPLLPNHERQILTCVPPFIWPEPRVHAGSARYDLLPPFEPLLKDADLIAGLLIDVTDKAVQWIDSLMNQDGECKIKFVAIVYPAGPTQEEHLSKIRQIHHNSSKRDIEVRLFPVSNIYGNDCMTMMLPPTVLQIYNSRSGRTTHCVGSTGNAGRGEIGPTSFNVVFQPDDALRDAWRSWFQYFWDCAAPLTFETVRIPHLTPAKGDPAAAEAWKRFESICRPPQAQISISPLVDSETSEVALYGDDEERESWDEGKTALDPLAQKIQQVYSQGYLVTVDESTRIKPLDIPVAAELLNQKAERTIGAIRQKQSFTLRVLDDLMAKEIEECRSITDILNLLSYSLSHSIRWVSEAAKDLLDHELETRNQRAGVIIRRVFGGNCVSEFVESCRDKFRSDLDEMYRQLGQGTAVPDSKFETILSKVQERLSKALKGRIAPCVIYNRISPPDLTASAPDENWSQPLSLLIRSARFLRQPLTDRFFAGKPFSKQEIFAAMDVFDDGIVKRPNQWRCPGELSIIKLIEEGDEERKRKCEAIWQIISGR
jgi:hypothetical protein